MTMRDVTKSSIRNNPRQACRKELGWRALFEGPETHPYIFQPLQSERPQALEWWLWLRGFLRCAWESLWFWKCSRKESFANFHLHDLAWLQIFLGFFVFFFNAIIGFTVDYKGKMEVVTAHLPRSASRPLSIICKALLLLHCVTSGRLSSLQWYFLISWNVSSGEIILLP